MRHFCVSLAAYYVVFVEFAERFSFYGTVRPILFYLSNPTILYFECIQTGPFVNFGRSLWACGTWHVT